MVTKSDFDKALIKIIFQIDELRSHTDLSIQHAEERIERRFTIVEEQYRLDATQAHSNLVQAVIHQLQGAQDQLLMTICDEMHSKLQVLESKFDKVIGTDQGQHTTVHLERTVSAFRAPLQSKGDSSGTDFDFLKRDTRFQFPRAHCPAFKGDNLVEWLRKSQSFF
jgi:hypothetical protein